MIAIFDERVDIVTFDHYGEIIDAGWISREEYDSHDMLNFELVEEFHDVPSELLLLGTSLLQECQKEYQLLKAQWN